MTCKMIQLRSKVIRLCVSCLFMVIVCSKLSFGLTNPCPSFNVQVPENTQIGTVLFSFSSDSATNIALLPKDRLRFNGYLALRRNVDRSYSIYLSKSLDLNTLNPRPTPVPFTDEVLQCNKSTSSLPAPQTVYRTVEYNMHCDVSLGQSTVPVTSDVIVAIEDINDNAPYFLCAPYHKQINELTPVYTTVFTLKGLAADLDIDGGIAGYGLSGGGDGYFILSGGASVGYIVLQKPLDYDYGRTAFVLNVTTTDIGEPTRTNWAQLHIQVTDGDDQNPAFSDDIYTLTLPEMDQSIIGQPVETTPPLKAWDMDKGLNATVRYSLEAGTEFQGQRYFRLDPDTGQIIPLLMLDRAKKSQFILSVKAYQADNPQNRVTSTTLIITVQDRNIHAPQFVPSEYNVTIPENAPAGYQLLQLRAQDDDYGSNAVLSYHIIDMTGTFTIDASSGSVSVQKNDLLDRETRPFLSFTVYAEEIQTFEKHISNNATVRVALRDENDNSPVFQNVGPAGTYYFSADKTSVTGTMVGTISATDSDEGLNGQVRYTVLYGSENAMARFALDPVSGNIRTLASLDQPYLSSYAMTVQAFDQAPAGMRSAVAILNITVRADNIHAPKFVSTPYMTTLSEASSVGTIVFTVEAQDADSPVLLYSITRGNVGDVFTIQRYSGVISLWRPLDRETKDSYSLTVIVTDNLNRAETEVIIRIADVNDNDPVFGQLSYNFEVVEEQSAGLEAGAVQAVDADLGVNADIRYEIGQDWAEDYFSMDGTSGLIRTTQTLDREMQASYQFLVVARDRGTQSRSGTATVVVHVMDVNDQPPVFHQARYEVAILEMSEPQVILQVQATDKDVQPYNEVRYSISSGKTNMFGIDPITGRITTKMVADLSPNSAHLSQEILVIKAYNTRSYYRQNVQNASTTVVINFVDVNNNKPIFTENVYRVDVLESAAIGSSLVTVLALDYDTNEDNRQVSYWMESDDTLIDQKFHVEKSTGVVRLMQPLNADPPANHVNFVFKVLASDLKVSSTTRAIENATAIVNITVIDVNDERPKFSQDFYEVIVSEDTPIGAIILSDLHAEDKDRGRNGEVMYLIQAVDVPFEVDQNLGHLKVKRSLDYDNIEHQTYSLEIIAVDKGQLQLTGTTTVEIYLENVNDNSPVFKTQQPDFDIVENLRNNTLVGQVVAFDADLDIVAYTLLNNKDKFRIDNNTGQLFSKQPLDFEEEVSYTLNISASDAFNATGFFIESRHTTYTQVLVKVIDQNDNYPVFMQSNYRVTIREGIESKLLVQVSAMDKDVGAAGDVKYSIVAGNEGDIFDIDGTTGYVKVSQGHLLNYKRKKLHHLVVQAKDGGQPSLAGMADIFVTVEDTNDQPPVFPFDQYKAEVPENTPMGYKVIQIQAFDEDSDSRITYKMSLDSAPFTIDPQTGFVSTTANLDREVTASYILEIIASDGQHESRTSLSVTVTDVNDHAPVFTQDRYLKIVSPQTRVGQVVVSVSATDTDEERNGAVSYWLSGGLGLFEINPVSGDISVKADLTKHTSKPVILSVYARDYGYPSLVSNSSVYFYLNGSNAYYPEISQFVYKETIDENAAVGDVVLAITATDLDNGIEGQVTLDIIEGNVGEVFSIDNTGKVRVARLLDYETKNRYELTIRAKDSGSDPKSSNAIVHVTVKDVNDNAPQFLSLPNSIKMQGPLLQSEPITILVAKDPDGENNNQITYTLLNWNNQFLLDPKTGELNVSTVIQGGTFNLTVRGQDNGIPPLFTEATFTLTVLRIGAVSEQALFDRLAYQVKVPEFSRIPLSLIDLNARQQNRPNDQGVTYRISGGHDRSHFQINPDTGELSLIRKLNFSSQSTHSLLIQAFSRSDIPPSEAIVVVHVQDVNMEPPQFEFSKYTAEIREDFQVGGAVITLLAHDQDQNAVLHYKITHDDSGGKFKIFTQANQGVIRLTERLDRDAMPLSSAGIYRLRVNVTDGFNDSGPASVLIKIIDINDNSPVFPQDIYNITVKENAGPCQEIFLVSAQDADPMDVGNLTYSISSGNTENIFSIHRTTGMLSMSCNTSTSLDRETKDSHNLMVKVEDSAGHQTQAMVNINVKDENDTPPQFVGLPYIVSVNEGQESLSLRIGISAIDLDLDSRVSFKFLTTYPHFNITTTKESSTARGEIMVVRQLDREAIGVTRLANGSAVYNLVVVAVDKDFPALSSTTTVTVLVGDINDNAPKFTNPAFEVTLSEGTPIGTMVTKVEATDADVGASLTYSFITDGPFQMRGDTGDIIVAEELNTVAGQIMELEISVTDGIMSSNGILIVRLVDANNNDPRFERSSYQFSVPENDHTGQLGMFVGKVSAYDLDLGANGKVTYFISSKTEGRFHIHQDSGEITVSGILDREEHEIYDIIITAKDDGNPSRKTACEVQVVIGDANDNPPVFEEANYVGQVTEHSPAGTEVSVLGNIKATDKDAAFNSQVLYSLHGMSAGLFSIDENTGVIRVGDAGKDQLDRERQRTIELQVMAADQHGSFGGLNATASLLIYLLDINDNPPRFSSPFRFTISESVKQYHPVGVVSASDPDANTMMTYAVVSGGDGNFLIERNNGTLYMIGSVDFETKSVYNLNVSANDNGLVPHSLSAYTLVTVSLTDENDNSPIFVDNVKEMSVRENQPAGTIVGRVNVTDRDSGENAKITLSLSDAGPFTIDGGTGVVTTKAQLDREGQASYNLLVLATDKGSPSLSTMASFTVKVLDANDHNPQFSQDNYTVSMAEGSPVGSVVLLSKAGDEDEGQNGQLVYSLGSDSGVHQYFSIHATTAVVSLVRPISRARWLAQGMFDSDLKTVSMVITATDKGLPPRSGDAQIKVQLADVADSSPRFSLAAYEMSIVENIPGETVVGQVRATSTDSDLQMKYSLPHSTLFSIHSDTGYIKTKGNLVLDREVQDFHSFTVKVTDTAVPPRSSFALVSIKVTDENDNSPVFKQSAYNLTVKEDLANLPKAIGQITAVDIDLDENAKVTYSLISGNTDGTFILDDKVGVLAVSEQLDRETLDVYHLKLKAVDHGNPPRSSTVDVSVFVLDENDNVPQFEGHPYAARVDENGPAGEEVAAVYASDADEGPAGTVVYELLDHDVPFYLQARDGLGLVYTQKGLDFEKTSSYNLTVMAHDLGTPSLFSLTYIFVNVTDLPDAVPHFDRDAYDIYVQDSIAPGSEVFTVEAGEGNFIYEILGGNLNRMFMLNATTGRLLLLKPLDFKETKKYELIVVAYASGRRRDSDTTKIHIDVVESQPVPEFPQSQYIARIMENLVAPQLLLDLNTFEELAGVKVKYFIVNKDPSLYGLFNVEADSGKLWVTRSLDREAKAEFKVLIGCQQLMIHHRVKRQIYEYSQVEVLVEVGDLNDNPPMFLEKPVIVGVQEAAAFTDPITKLKIFDPDAANGTSHVFSISGGPDFDLFHLEPQTGVLFPKMNFRLTSQHIYHITVNVTDDWGMGYSDQTDVKILVLTGKHTAVLIAKIPPQEFKAKQDVLMSNLSQIIDLQLYIEKLEPHIITQDGRPSVDITRTDAYFHGIDRDTQRAVSRDEIMRKISEHSKEIEDLFGQYFIQEIRAAAVSSGGKEISGAEIALIVIACVIFCGAILGVCIVCLSHSKQRVSKHNQTAPSYATLSRQGLNPGDSPPCSSRTSSDTSCDGKSTLFRKNGSAKLNLYADNIGFQSDYPDGKNGLAHPDLIDGPTYCMFLPEADSVSNHSYHENPGPLQFVSYDKDGKPVLVVDHEPGGSGNGHQPWTSPYTGDACSDEPRPLKVVANGVVHRAAAADFQEFHLPGQEELVYGWQHPTLPRTITPFSANHEYITIRKCSALSKSTPNGLNKFEIGETEL